MTMRNIECEMFIYDEEDFTRFIIIWFKFCNAKELKDIIEDDANIKEKPKSFRTAVYRRLLNQKNGRDWFISTRELTPFEKEQERDELIAIWKMGIRSAKAFYQQCYLEESKDAEPVTEDDNDDRTEYQKGIDMWFDKTLTGFEEDLEKGEINEQQYIIRCNNMKRDKQRTEDLFNACICSVLGRQNKAKVGGDDAPITDIFRIMCMPCGFLN